MYLEESREEFVLGVCDWGVFGVNYGGFWWLVIKGLNRLIIWSFEVRV